MKNSTIYFEPREVNEDNVLVRNVLVEFEDSLKYVSSNTSCCLAFLVNDQLHWLLAGTDSTASPGNQGPQLT